MPRTERSPVRVLVLSADYAPGALSGIGTAVATQATAVARRRVEVDVLVPADHPAIRSRAPPVRAPDAGGFPPRAAGFDVVHVHSLALAELALQLRERFGLPLVYTSHASVRDE